MKVLVILKKSRSELMSTVPMLRSIKSSYGNAQIHFLSHASLQSIIDEVPYIDKSFFFDEDLRAIVFKLLAEKYDLLLDLQRNHKSWYVKSILKQAYNTSLKVRSISKEKSIFRFAKRNNGVHQVDRFFKLVDFLKLKNDGLGLEHSIPEADQIKPEDLPMSHSAGYISFLIGGYETRKMTAAKWKELAEAVEYPIILQGDLKDHQTAELIRSIDPIRIYNSCGKFNFNEGADILRFAKVVVSGDNDYLPLIGVYKRKTISIWGSTSAEQSGRFPYYGYNNLTGNASPDHIAIQVKGLSCRPCNAALDSDCPKGHFKCMKQIDVSKIADQIKTFLSAKEKA